MPWCGMCAAAAEGLKAPKRGGLLAPLFLLRSVFAHIAADAMYAPPALSRPLMGARATWFLSSLPLAAFPLWVYIGVDVTFW